MDQDDPLFRVFAWIGRAIDKATKYYLWGLATLLVFGLLVEWNRASQPVPLSPAEQKLIERQQQRAAATNQVFLKVVEAENACIMRIASNIDASTRLEHYNACQWATQQVLQQSGLLVTEYEAWLKECR